jgi:hypothetical protein
MKTKDPEIIISEYLGPDERLLWSGRPNHKIRLQFSDLFFIPFSLMFGGFALFWEIMAIRSIGLGSQQAPLFVILFPLFGLPFVIAGLYLIIGRFFVDAKIRENTFYAVTSNRIIILHGIFNRKLTTLPLKTLQQYSLSLSKSRRGSIFFGNTNLLYQTFSNSAWPGVQKHRVPFFDSIENVEYVYNLIRETQST